MLFGVERETERERYSQEGAVPILFHHSGASPTSSLTVWSHIKRAHEQPPGNSICLCSLRGNDFYLEAT